MINDTLEGKEDIDTSSGATSMPTPPSVDAHKQPILPYVFDFMKFVGGFTLIIGIALIIIQKVAVY